MVNRDPFTGTWIYRAERLRSTGPKLERWVQWIEATEESLRVREEVAVATGQRANVSLEAKFDGKDYPVTGSSLANAVAYTRVDRNNIAGAGKKDGSVTLRETIAVSEDSETLTLTFSIPVGRREVMKGVAIFEREETSKPSG